MYPPGFRPIGTHTLPCILLARTDCPPLHRKSTRPYETFTSVDDLWDHTLLRLQSSSVLWHMEGVYGDVVSVCPSKVNDEPLFLYTKEAWGVGPTARLVDIRLLILQ